VLSWRSPSSTTASSSAASTCTPTRRTGSTPPRRKPQWCSPPKLLAIVNSTLYEQAHKIRTTLQEAHDAAAAAVSRAQGVLMGEHHVSAAQAEALIRSAADGNGEGVLQAAQRILAAAAETKLRRRRAETEQGVGSSSLPTPTHLPGYLRHVVASGPSCEGLLGGSIGSAHVHHYERREPVTDTTTHDVERQQTPSPS
jgi:hypothetical protein